MQIKLDHFSNVTTEIKFLWLWTNNYFIYDSAVCHLYRCKTNNTMATILAFQSISVAINPNFQIILDIGHQSSLIRPESSYPKVGAILNPWMGLQIHLLNSKPCHQDSISSGSMLCVGSKAVTQGAKPALSSSSSAWNTEQVFGLHGTRRREVGTIAWAGESLLVLPVYFITVLIRYSMSTYLQRNIQNLSKLHLGLIMSSLIWHRRGFGCTFWKCWEIQLKTKYVAKKVRRSPDSRL